MILNDELNCQVSTIFKNPRSIHVETLSEKNPSRFSTTSQATFHVNSCRFFNALSGFHGVIDVFRYSC
jgi:hypothetical protein